MGLFHSARIRASHTGTQNDIRCVSQAGDASKQPQDAGHPLTHRAIEHKIQKLYMRKQGGSRRLLLSPGDPSTWIPLVDKAEYLGLIISYDRFEWQSVKHRVAKGHQRRWALASILHSRRVSIHYKLRLWRSSVLSTMMYALHCLCLQTQHIKYIQRAIVKHTRAITLDQPFLTGRTHAEIMTKYHIRPALDLLQKAHAREQSIAQHGDWIVEQHWNQVIGECLQSASTSSVPNSDTEGEIWACPVCSEQFTTPAALKLHARRKHKLVDSPAQVFDRTKHSIAGLPQCSGCLKKFSRWQTLAWHINHHACPVFNTHVEKAATCAVSQHMSPGADAESHVPDASDVQQAQLDTAVHTSETLVAGPRSEVTQLDDVGHACGTDTPLIQQTCVQKVVQQGVNHFIHHPALTKHMMQHCAICGQWVASQKVMKLHYRNTHKDLYQMLSGTTQFIIEQRATPCVACHYCHRTVKDWKAHLCKCTPLWQAAFMCAYHQIYVQAGDVWGPGNGRILWHGERPPERESGDGGVYESEWTLQRKGPPDTEQAKERAPGESVRSSSTSSQPPQQLSGLCFTGSTAQRPIATYFCSRGRTVCSIIFFKQRKS